MKKQLFPILLSLVMVLMLLPSPALAVNGEGASIMFCRLLLPQRTSFRKF